MSAKILVVEDDVASGALARYLLVHAGYDVHVVTDGERGVQFALELAPDLILCDMQLPGKSGYVIAQELRSNPRWRAVPLIAVTALSMPGDRERTLSAGFDHYLAKPIAPETFVREVEAFLPSTRTRLR
jgi:two-component system cell cycle response regulator DivK